MKAKVFFLFFYFLFSFADTSYVAEEGGRNV
jgi:hypothetical protein